MKIEYHWKENVNSVPTDKTKIITIEKGHSLKETFYLNDPHEVIILECSSVRLIFNDTKELWYYSDKEEDKAGYIFNLKYYNYKKDSGLEENIYLYYITGNI